MSGIKRRETALEAVVIGVGRCRSTRQIIYIIRKVLTECIADAVRESLRKAPAQGDEESIIIRVTVVCGKLQIGVAARDARLTRIEVRIREEDNWLSGCAIAFDDRLVGIPQTVFLATKIADIINVQHCSLRKLQLRAKTGLLDVGRPLIRILRTDLQLRQADQRWSELGGGKSVTQQEGRRRAGKRLSQRLVQEKWWIFCKHTL